MDPDQWECSSLVLLEVLPQLGHSGAVILRQAGLGGVAVGKARDSQENIWEEEEEREVWRHPGLSQNWLLTSALVSGHLTRKSENQPDRPERACKYRFYRGVFHDNKYKEILKEQKDIFKEINI